jgi:hypothetical protein
MDSLQQLLIAARRLARAALPLAVVAAVAAVAPLGACVPQNLSPQCREMISECLKDCTGDPGRDNRWQQTNVGSDSRTQCEQHCHGICHD